MRVCEAMSTSVCEVCVRVCEAMSTSVCEAVCEGV